MSDKTPMERDFPTICDWTRHRGVSTDRLIEELQQALAFLTTEETVEVPKAALQRLLAETRAPVALGQISAKTAWETLADKCGMTEPLEVPC